MPHKWQRNGCPFPHRIGSSPTLIDLHSCLPTNVRSESRPCFLPINPYSDLAKSHYSAASRVPLIQSPSLRVPRPVSNNTQSQIPQILDIYMGSFYTGRAPTGHSSSPREHKRIRKWVVSFRKPRFNLTRRPPLLLS